MIDRKLVERLLTANGVDSSAPDEEIKALLISAKWHKDDVDAAITVLRENNETHQKRVDTIEHVFRSDDRLKPETISSLLGISIDVPLDSGKHKKGGATATDVIGIIAVSVLFSSFFVLGTMWFLKVGLFYPADL